jgi:hypothetical protein
VNSYIFFVNSFRFLPKYPIKQKEKIFMKTIHKISSWIVLVLGIGHTLATPIFYSGFTEDALWFAATGLGLIFLGLLNLEVFQNPTPTGFNLCIVANALASLLFGIMLPLVGLNAPQAYLAVGSFLGALVGSTYSRKTIS